MNRRLVLALAFFASVFSAPVHPAQAGQPALNDPLLDHLAGRWILTGMIDGRQTTHDVTARWVLQHHYVQFREISRDRQKDGTPAYQATVYFGWNPKAKRYGCVWLDDYGGLSTQSIGSAPPDVNRIAFVFLSTSDASRFHTTFAYDEKTDQWIMNMDQEDKGKFTPFARTLLRRK